MIFPKTLSCFTHMTDIIKNSGTADRKEDGGVEEVNNEAVIIGRASVGKEA